ncbi:MAG: hypothetical protein WC679_11375 [Bacteroidales bacterium]|jgi:hypothetical protein
MNDILALQKQANELSTKICSFCKPLMLSTQHKNQVHQLLSSEADLRLSIELAMEVKTKKDFLEKLSLAQEEAEIILYMLMQFKEEKINEISPMKELAKKIINTIKQIK